MPVYRYTALPVASRAASSHDDTGRGAARSRGLARGTLAADSDQHLRAALRGMGLQPLSVRPLRRSNAAPSGRWRSRRAATPDPDQRIAAKDSGAWAGADDEATLDRPRARRFEIAASLARRRRSARLVEFYESLATLLASGAPLASSLELLGPRTRASEDASRSGVFARLRAGLAGGRGRGLETVALELAERVRAGDSLAEALARRPEWFGPVDRALVASCERSGHAERALADLADLHARGEDLRGRLAGALAYPALLLVFGLGVVGFLTTTTLPQLAGVLNDADAPLPPATAALLAFGGLLTAHWPLAVAMMATLIAIGLWLTRSDRFARARLSIPLLGRAALRGQTSAAALLLARLLDAGAPLSEAIELVAPSVPNAALREELRGLRAALVSGGSPSARAASGGLIEPVFCRVLEVAEESGEIAGALRTIGARQRESARRLIDRLAATLEPVVILLLACGIGFVVYAAIAPMLRVAQTL